MEFALLFFNTILLRPYVFFFLGVSLFASRRLLGWKRTGLLFGLTWLIAFLAEFSSTRIGFPFGDYYYNASTVGQELYILNIPFMDSLSFTFLLYASYCMALTFALSTRRSGLIPRWDCNRLDRTSWAVVCLTTLFMTFIDIVIDPVALRGDRWFLGLIYGYPDTGVYFGVPIANFLGWATVGLSSIGLYGFIDRSGWLEEAIPDEIVSGNLLWGVALYYLVLGFNLVVTFWIGEYLIGMVGCLIFLPISVLLGLRICHGASAPQTSQT
ncbi:MAG: carotenoid biosynthesis protein [Nitrospirales bacterium]|nr:carotenoid biosynthesis protein [Nitrospira sp.]MDR4500828.1 carotenoid biosynthesis protein [Nitrospirales bacterium]